MTQTQIAQPQFDAEKRKQSLWQRENGHQFEESCEMLIMVGTR